MYFSVEIFRCLDSGQAGNVERMRYCRVSLSVHCPQGDNVTQVNPPAFQGEGYTSRAFLPQIVTTGALYRYIGGIGDKYQVCLAALKKANLNTHG